MNTRIVIRRETDADVGMIGEVTIAAFKTLEISNHTEQFVIASLRAFYFLLVLLKYRWTLAESSMLFVDN